MAQRFYSSSKYYYLILGFVFLLTFHYGATAQTWTGTTTASVNQTYSYSYHRSAPFSSFTFTAASGTVITSTLSPDRTTAYADIKWITPGTGTITLKAGTTTVSTLSVSISCGAMSIPSQITYRLPDQVASNISCVGSSFRINATRGTNGIAVNWYHSASDASPFYVGDTYTTPALSINTTYYISTLYYAGNLSIESVSATSAKAVRTTSTTSNATSSAPCESSRVAVPITIGPVPTFSIAGYSYQICSEEFALFQVASNPYAFSWTVDVSNVNGASPGSSSDSDISQKLTNNTSTIGTATYTFRPYAYGCFGAPVSATVNVKPLPLADGTGQTICSSGSTSIVVSNTNAITGTTFNWSVGSVSNVIGAASGTGNTINQVLTNESAVDGTVTYYVAPTAAGCVGTSVPITVIVKAPPAVSGSDQSIPSGTATSVLLSNPYGTSGTTFSWTVNAPGITGATGGGGSSIAQTLICPTGSGCSATYNVTPMANGCTGASKSFVVTVLTSSFDENYIITNVITAENITDAAMVDVLMPSQRTQQIQYFDGIGRPSQIVNTQTSPELFDIVQPIEYDALGRENKKYLPYRSSSSNGWYKINSLTDQANFYSEGSLITADENPFSKTIFEPSPVNRPMKQGAEGAAWQPNEDINSVGDATIKHRYTLNHESEIYLFTYNDAGIALGEGSNKFYEPHTLTSNKTYDENNFIVIEFSDKKGRLICKKVQFSSTAEPLAFAETYYIYDDFGNLVMVLPPEAVVKIKTQLGN